MGLAGFLAGLWILRLILERTNGFVLSGSDRGQKFAAANTLFCP